MFSPEGDSENILNSNVFFFIIMIQVIHECILVKISNKASIRRLTKISILLPIPLLGGVTSANSSVFSFCHSRTFFHKPKNGLFGFLFYINVMTFPYS